MRCGRQSSSPPPPLLLYPPPPSSAPTDEPASVLRCSNVERSLRGSASWRCCTSHRCRHHSERRVAIAPRPRRSTTASVSRRVALKCQLLCILEESALCAVKGVSMRAAALEPPPTCHDPCQRDRIRLTCACTTCEAGRAISLAFGEPARTWGTFTVRFALLCASRSEAGTGTRWGAGCSGDDRLCRRSRESKRVKGGSGHSCRGQAPVNEFASGDSADEPFCDDRSGKVGGDERIQPGHQAGGDSAGQPRSRCEIKIMNSQADN